MGKKVIGMARNVGRTARQRRWARVLSLVVVVGAGLFFMRNVLAVHDNGLFELDRNALDSASAGEDWESIYKSKLSPPTGVTVAGASAFTHDPDGATIFTQGGSKDDLDTTNWRHTAGSVPDKDELADAFAARYGDILYFGADRIANNGDAVMGFWFFQNEIAPQADGTFGPGQHEDGDILVLSDFSKGGGLVTIRVFRWNGPGGSIAGQGAINGTLDLIAGSLETPADCVGPPSTPANDPFCATVNAATTPSPWPFTPKSGTGGFQKGEFYEGGIDLGFLNLGEECFASFLAETRSSTSVDAVLKDFVGGSFEKCSSSVKTTPSDVSKNPVTQISLGGSIYDYAVVTGTGSNSSPTGTMTFHICKPSEVTNGGCETGGTLVGAAVGLTPIAATNPPQSEALSASYTPTETGTWCWRGDYSGDSNYPASSDSSAGECFLVVQLQPTISTVQTWKVEDKATITVAAGAGNLAGSVKFELFLNSTTCANSPVLTTTKSISGALSQDATSDTLTITVPGGPNTYSWKVTYTSTNPGHKDVTSACNTENGTLTFTNGS